MKHKSHLLIFFYDFLMTFSLLWNTKEDILKANGVQTLDLIGFHCMEKIYFRVRIFFDVHLLMYIYVIKKYSKTNVV